MEGQFEKVTLRELASVLKDGQFGLMTYIPEIRDTFPTLCVCPNSLCGAEKWLEEMAMFCQHNGNHVTFGIRFLRYIFFIRKWDDGTWGKLEVVL